MNTTPSSERLHIGFFGMRNAGKSSLVNAVTGQNLALVSDIKGTTTDPVKKAMELLPLGPVVIIDTPGLDDEGVLGEMRVKRAKDMLSSVHIAVLVVDASKGLSQEDKSLAAEIESRKLPLVIAMNKTDLLGSVPADEGDTIYVSAGKNKGINELKEKIASLSASAKTEKKILADLVSKGDIVVLVTPIDESAPKGRTGTETALKPKKSSCEKQVQRRFCVRVSQVRRKAALSWTNSWSWCVQETRW